MFLGKDKLLCPEGNVRGNEVSCFPYFELMIKKLFPLFDHEVFLLLCV